MKRPRMILMGAILLVGIAGILNHYNAQKLQANIRRSEGLMERSKVESQVDLADSLIRFHVLANSDSQEDQEIKHMVRDEVLKEIVPFLQHSQSLQESRSIIDRNKPRMIKTAKRVLKENGKTYSVTAALGSFTFPTKYYGNFSLPAGEYEAFRLVLGEGKGANWWCVMFPPLCFVNVDEDQMEKQEEEPRIEDLIQPAANIEDNKDQKDGFSEGKSQSVEIRWRIVEFFQSIF